MLPAEWLKPSTLRDEIQQLWPGREVQAVSGNWGPSHSGTVAAILDLLEQVDPGLLLASLPPPEAREWRRRIISVRSAVRRWESGGSGDLNFDDVKQLHALLRKVQDELAPRSEPQLGFVQDELLRRSIARDLDSMERLVRMEEWKAATVLGGSVLEALLLEVLSRQDHLSAALAAEEKHINRQDPRWHKQPIESWDLWKLIAVAHELRVIDDTVEPVCQGARGYRNLIHPGKERLTIACDKPTALTAAAAVGHVIRALDAGPPRKVT